MDASPTRLLCIDLQIDPALGLEPDAKSIFGARQLLTIGRRLGWTVAHARRRASSISSNDHGEALVGAMRPLMSERVFFRRDRSISGSPGILQLLEDWRGEAVFVAAFDHVALLSSLLACYEHGPRLVLVEDVLSLHALTGKTSIDAFRTAAWHLAAGTTSIARIVADTQLTNDVSMPRAPPAPANLSAS
jgi:Isochorismatase family